MNPHVAQLISTWLSSEGESERFAKRAEMIGQIKRWKDIEGISNFRDLGGWQTKNADYIRPDRIYRCADLSNITDLGRSALKHLRITKVFDLRSLPEVTKNGVGRVDGIQWLHAPVFREQDYSPEKMAIRWGYYTSGVEGFILAYTGILQNGGHPFGMILRHLRDSDDPIIIHCTAGKDRTGVICAIILKLLGCDDEVVAREYELTTIGLQGGHSKILAAVAHEGGTKAVATHDADGHFKEGILNMMSSKSISHDDTDIRYEAMIQTLALIKSEYGGAEGYVKKVCGLTDEDIIRIRERLLINDGETRERIGWRWGHVSRL
jgi:protein tyrosine/serine phosphatase